MSQTIMQGVVTWYPVKKKNQKIEVVSINKTQRYSETKGVCKEVEEFKSHRITLAEMLEDVMSSEFLDWTIQQTNVEEQRL